MIFIDANVPMYLIGADHPNKLAARRLVERAAAARERLVTDTEVYQEILHRFTAIDRRDAIDPAFEALSAIANEVYPVTRDDVFRARRLVLSTARLAARDAIHIAVMERNGVDRIMSFDASFDAVPGIRRET